MKIFCIGFNKTGVKSLEQVFREQLGLEVSNDPRWTYWSQTRDRARLDRYQAFVDGECANLQNLEALYPEALFVLNTRNLANWLTSRHQAIGRTRFLIWWFLKRAMMPRMLLDRLDRVLRNDARTLERWVRIRNSYHRYALNHFRDRPDRLLILDMEAEGQKAFERLTEFLELKTPVEPVHRNRAGDGTRTGRMYIAIRGDDVNDREESREEVERFLSRSGLGPFADNNLVVEEERWSLPPNHIDRLLKSYPALSRVEHSCLQTACRMRQGARSFATIMLADRLVAMLRRQEQMDAFIPVNRYGSGSW